MVLREEILQQLKAIINESLADENVRVYLFGSWARCEEKQSSDIDIAIEENSQLSSSKWIELTDKIEESTIPYNVDVVNINDTTLELAKQINEEGIVWKDFKKG